MARNHSHSANRNADLQPEAGGGSEDATVRLHEPAGERAGEPDANLDGDAEVVSYDRSPLDLFRLVVWAVAALAVTLATRFLRESVDGVEQSMSSLLSVDIGAVRVALDILLLATTVIATLVVLIIPLVTRRWRLFGYVLTANVLASLAISAINAWVGDLDVAGTGAGSAQDLGLDLSTDVAAATQMVAAFVAVAPFVSSRWRHLGMWLVGVLMVLRLAVATGTSTHTLLVLSVGAAIGSGVLLMFGRPTTQPSASSIVEALRSSGVPVVSIHRASVDARGSVPWFAETADGSELFVKVLGTDQRAADLLFRVYRMLRLRNVGDERPFSSLRRTVEHEALVALAARDVEVRTPRLRAMASVGGDSFLLSYERIAGRSLDEVDVEDLTDEVLTGIWEQVALLREHRIAHRDLRLANVFLTPEGEPLIIDFGFSEIAAETPMLQADLAQLLVSLSLKVGVHRAAVTAIDILGPDAVGATLARMQPAAMSGATQASLKTREGLITELRTEVEKLCGVAPPQLEPVTRITPFAVAGLLAMVAVIYFLLPQLTDLPGLFGEFAGIDPWWVIPALATTAGGLVAAAVATTGSVRTRLPAGPTLVAQTATYFAGKFRPAGVGAIAVDLRYIQRQGVDPSAATRSIGLRGLAGFVSWLTLTVIFVLWAIRETDGDIITSPRSALVGLSTVVLLSAAAMAVPATRRTVIRTYVPLLRGTGAGLRAQLSSPGKLSWVFLGTAAERLLEALTFFYAAQVFGLTYGFAVLAAIYLLSAGIAGIAPTPGGLGAVEIALTSALLAIGVDSAVAVPMVILYRVLAFWLPAIPGWVAFKWLRSTDRL